jgi:hemerythrin-like domain-containing protein
MSDPELSGADSIPMSEHNRVLVAVHHAMRADGRRLAHAAAQLSEGDVERASALGRAFAAIATLVHDHHWTEDDVMYPFLVERVASFERDVIRLEDDHVELDAAMARIGARFRLLSHALNAGLWRDTRRHLVEEATTFHELLVDHLDREEAIVLPAVDVMLSSSDQRALHKKESKLATYRHMRMAVPWVLANATPEQAAELRATAPKLLAAVQDHVWARHFERVMAPLYGVPTAT